MKRISFFLLICLLTVVAQAQDKPLFIYEQFANAKIHFKNRSVTVAPMNYDAVNDKMFYKDKGELMELTNFAMIDSIVWSGKRTFVPYGQGFLEQIKMENGTVFVRWRIKNVNVGSRGALGTVTQAKVETISVRSMGVFSATDASSQSADVYQQKNANEYYLPFNGKLNKITTLKHLYKLYPAFKDAIKEYADKEKIKMNEPLSVLQVLNYCMGLK
jgi:hypothetical protein